MSKVRINDLARELEVKSKAILDTLPLVGVTEKKTHSSSLEEHEAEKVRIHLRGSSEGQTSSARSARPLRGEEEIKTKIDLSRISRPGDVLKAITQKQETAAAPARPVAPTAQAGAPAGTLRPAPGRPVPGQPIFQRPRPQVPGGGPPRPLRPGERRPMHPTRTAPAGARPLGVGPGLPPPGPARPGARPGAPARRPGQRYVPRGVKEGPMKGYTPPPRMVVSNEPMPITRSITITEGISVKDLAEKLEIRAKDLISRLLSKGVFATINQTLDAELASEMARFFGADTNVITFEEQTAKEVDAAAANEQLAPETGIRPPVV